MATMQGIRKSDAVSVSQKPLSRPCRFLHLLSFAVVHAAALTAPLHGRRYKEKKAEATV
jgi:hypothetical protein